MHSSKYSDQSYLCLAQAESGKREGQRVFMCLKEDGGGEVGDAKNMM